MDSVHKAGAEGGDEDVKQVGGVVAVDRLEVGLERHQQSAKMSLALTARSEGVNNPFGDRSRASCVARRITTCGACGGPPDPLFDVNPRSTIGHRQVEAGHEPRVQVWHERSPIHLQENEIEYQPVQLPRWLYGRQACCRV